MKKIGKILTGVCIVSMIIALCLSIYVMWDFERAYDTKVLEIIGSLLVIAFPSAMFGAVLSNGD